MVSVISLIFCTIPLTSWEKPAPEQSIYENQALRVVSDPVEDYRQLVEIFDWDEIFEKQNDTGEISLLEVGCGTGRWLDTVQYELFQGDQPQKKWRRVTCDLLDPSETAMGKAEKKILPPWTVGQKIKSTLQNAELKKDHYDLIWSTHAFYAIPKGTLSEVFRKMRGSLKSKGKLIIAHSSRSSFYFQCYEAFKKAYPDSKRQTYTTAEDIKETLKKEGVPFELDIIEYDEKIHKRDEQTLDHFISNECIDYSFNRDLDRPSNITFYDFLSTSSGKTIIDPYLENDEYVFPQKVYIFTIRGTH